MTSVTDDNGKACGLRIERSNDVVTVALDRPKWANALDAGTVEQLLSTVESAYTHSSKALVLRGDGRHFCAGFDMTGVLEASDGDLLLRFVRIEQFLQRLRRAPFLTIACVAGKAIGAGADIVAACTHRLLDPVTALRFPGFRFGVALGTRHLATVIGTRAAREFLVESREVTAAEALEIGLGTATVAREHQNEEVDRIVAAADNLDSAVRGGGAGSHLDGVRYRRRSRHGSPGHLAHPAGAA